MSEIWTNKRSPRKALPEKIKVFSKGFMLLPGSKR